MDEQNELRTLFVKWKSGILSDLEFRQFNELLRNSQSARQLLLEEQALTRALNSKQIVGTYRDATRFRWPRWVIASIILCVFALNIFLYVMEAPSEHLVIFDEQRTVIHLNNERVRVEGDVGSQVQIIQDDKEGVKIRLETGSISNVVLPGETFFQVLTESGAVQSKAASFTMRSLPQDDDAKPSQTLVWVTDGSVEASGAWGEVNLAKYESHIFPKGEWRFGNDAANNAMAEVNLSQSITIRMDKKPLTKTMNFIAGVSGLAIEVDPDLSRKNPFMTMHAKNVTINATINNFMWSLNLPDYEIFEDKVYVGKHAEQIKWKTFYDLSDLHCFNEQGLMDRSLYVALSQGMGLENDRVDASRQEWVVQATTSQHKHFSQVLRRVRQFRLREFSDDERALVAGPWIMHDASFVKAEQISVDFKHERFRDVCAHIEKLLGVHIMIHPEVLESEEVMNHKLTLSKENEHYLAILNAACKQVGVYAQMYQSTVRIGYRQHMRNAIYTYPLFGPKKSFDTLEEEIMNKVIADWDDNNSWYLRCGEVLFVKASESNHQTLRTEIEHLKKKYGIIENGGSGQPDLIEDF